MFHRCSDHLAVRDETQGNAVAGQLARALEQARAEAAESRRQFNSLLEGLSGLFYRSELVSPWTMSFVSEGVEELTGYSPGEIGEKTGWAEIIFPHDRVDVEHAVADAISERRGFDITYRITHKLGQVRWVSERGRAVYDAAGTPLFLEGVISDISGRKQAEELQRTLLSRWRKTLDLIPQMVWTMAADGSDEFYNSQWATFVGIPVGPEHGVSRLELVHPADRDNARGEWEKCLASGSRYEAQYRLRHVSGDYRWILSRAHAEQDPEGCTILWYGTCTDIHEQVLAKEALQASEAVNRSMIEASPDCISLLDMDGRIRFFNASAVAALGLETSGSLIGRKWGHAFPPSSRGPAHRAISQAQSGHNGHFNTSQMTEAGRRWWDVIVAPIFSGNEGQTGILAIARDITYQKTAEERVRWAGNHDPLTLLPNRMLFRRALDQQLADADQSGGSLTVLMVDLDHLKSINDTLGHDAGDALLTEFSRRIVKAVRADDVVARLGGDEFAVLLRGVGSQEAIEAVSQSIMDRLKSPFLFEGKLLDIQVSIGASTFPHQGRSRSELLKHADIALYVAKAAGRGVMRTFQPSMRAEAQMRSSMLSLARDALTNQRIVPFYQPKINMQTCCLDGFEALLRWHHPTHGVQGPATIAAAFEDVTLAAEISDRMIDRAIIDMRLWRDRGVQFGHVAVNAAAAEFRRGDFADRLLERLHRAQLPPSCFQLEITETVFLGRGAEHVERALKTLSAEGVSIALDDFGTGFASLSHLSQFPVNVLKIDRSFVNKLEESAHHAAIVKAVINLGRSMQIRVVAEGVESASQADYLRRHRCHVGQGFLFGRAEPADAVPGMVAHFAGPASAAYPRWALASKG